MKKAKRLVSLLLAFVMLLSLTVVVGAVPASSATYTKTVTNITTVTNESDASIKDKTGSIKITSAVKDETYKLYQVLYLDQFTSTTDADGKTKNSYSYKAASDSWKNFLTNDEVAKKYINVDPDGHVTWKVTGTVNGSAPVVEFAQAAAAYAEKNGISPVSTTVMAPESSDTTAYDAYVMQFSGLHYGYYLVDSTVGLLCILNTVDKDTVDVNEKNTVPTVTKQVYDSSDWGSSNNETVGNFVYFKSKINVRRGATNLVFHDEMDDGLKFYSDTSSQPEAQTETLYKQLRVEFTKANASTGTTPTVLVLGTHYDLKTTSLSDNCDFEVVFKDAFYELLNAKDSDGNFSGLDYDVTIYYSAQVTEDAITPPSGQDGVKNKAKVEYGENHKFTKEPETITKTFEIPVFKFYGNGNEENPLADAEFILGRTVGTGAEEKVIYHTIKAVGSTDANSEAVYVVTGTTDDKEANNLKVVTNNSGKFRIKGLAAGNYKLYETKAPSGYNLLASAVNINIDAEGNVSVGSTQVGDSDYVKVRNSSGNVLPSTGGIGTTIFYVAGSILLIGAAVLLIVKKRMSDEK